MAAKAEKEAENGKTPKWGTGQSNRKAASAADSGCDFECVCVCVYGATANGCRLNWQHFIKKYKKH